MNPIGIYNFDWVGRNISLRELKEMIDEMEKIGANDVTQIIIEADYNCITLSKAEYVKESDTIFLQTE